MPKLDYLALATECREAACLVRERSLPSDVIDLLLAAALALQRRTDGQ